MALRFLPLPDELAVGGSLAKTQPLSFHLAGGAGQAPVRSRPGGENASCWSYGEC
jgi:hypothetical protein